LLTWSDLLAATNKIVAEVRSRRFPVGRVVGIGRSGAILAGMIAGNLSQKTRDGQHLPVDVINRYHGRTFEVRELSTLSEPVETYEGGKPAGPLPVANRAWDRSPVLVVLASPIHRAADGEPV